MDNRSLKKPVYKRQQFLVSFMKQLNESLTATDLQKLLFLFHKKNSLSYYDFVPYLYGCFSIQAAEDINTLQAMGWLSYLNENIQYSGNEEVYLHFSFEGIGANISDQLPKVRGNQLVKQVYKQYPYFAINSRIAESIMDAEGLTRIKMEKERIKQTRQMLFTIGYEGISVEQYINCLIKNDVHVLCDVRNNPLSRKFGFSKSPLQKYLSNIGIEYIHLPELGISSEKRNNLNSNKDYRLLFENYKSSLVQHFECLDRLHQILLSKGRIALTCFEHEPLHCHRHIIRDYLKETYKVETTDL